MAKHTESLRRRQTGGVGQLTLVEHALCPLDANVSLQENLSHQCEYFYTDAGGRRRLARVRVDCAAGLSASDEFFLWGLLALALAQPDQSFDFYATPHYCLKQLGCLSSRSKGGKNYALFRAALGRLAGVHYQSDFFYDPLRREHRAVSFRLLSYSLPIDPQSSRAWRIVWDPLFFEFCQAAGSQIAFDLQTYRTLDCASRRLFLLLKKIFWRKKETPLFDGRHLAVNVLGFSDQLETKTIKAKLKRCARQLLAQHIIDGSHGSGSLDGYFQNPRKGAWRIRFTRGPYFDRPAARCGQAVALESPLLEPLRAIGFDHASAAGIIRRFPASQVKLWTDVTLAALERKGKAFFRRSPQAFFMDNIQKAAQGQRTLPDWFWELRKQEQLARAEVHRQTRPAGRPPQQRSLEDRQLFEQVLEEMLAQFRAAGQSERDARRNAEHFAREHLRRKFKAGQGSQSLLKPLQSLVG